MEVNELEETNSVLKFMLFFGCASLIFGFLAISVVAT